MFAKDIMTTNPRSVTLKSSILKAYDIMKEYKHAQLPVVDDDNKLLGVITLEGIKNVGSTGELSNSEIKYILNKTKIRDIMQTGIIVIREDTIVENAALSIKENRISSVFVVDVEGKLLGILTRTDVFKALLDMMQIKASGIRLYFECTDEKNVYKELSDFFSDENIEILNLCVNKSNNKLLVSIKLNCLSLDDIVKTKLADLGYTLTSENYRM